LRLRTKIETTAATSVARSSLLASLEAPWFTDDQRVELLMLATLSRRPSDTEREALAAHVAAADDPRKKQEAFGDILWALLNSAEFAMIH